MRARIGITSGWEPGTVVNGWPLVYVNKDLVEAVEKAGGVAVILPVTEKIELYQDYMDMVDGLIVSGEVLSIKRNVFENGCENVLENSNPLRYRNERAALRAALQRGLPLLGICRGHQVLALEAGGTIKNEDITINNPVIHQQGEMLPPTQTIHNISIEPGTLLSRCMNAKQIRVNSFHRQAVDQIPAGYCASAYAEDGHIEAMEATDGRWVLGLQFHPETLKDACWEAMFRDFVQAAACNKEKE